MSRWINYDAIDYRNDKLHDKSEEFLNGVIYMAQRIEDAPSFDLVRCGECIRWENGRVDFSNCELMGIVKPDGFCSEGKRRESE